MNSTVFRKEILGDLPIDIQRIGWYLDCTVLIWSNAFVPFEVT